MYTRISPSYQKGNGEEMNPRKLTSILQGLLLGALLFWASLIYFSHQNFQPKEATDSKKRFFTYQQY